MIGFANLYRTAALAGFALLAACAPAAPAREAGPAKVVSLNPCIDAILVEIAEPGQVLALSHYSRDAGSSSLPPETVRQYATTGGTVEEIVALQPDIVLASTFIAPATRNALERLGLRVETFGSPISVDESAEQVERIGRLIDAPDAAARLVAEMRSEPASHRQRQIATMLWQPGQIVPGGQTLIAQLLADHGFTNFSEAKGLSQADFVSLEAVLADPPELLLVAGDSVGQRHPALEALSDTTVERLDPKLLYCGGPTIPQANARLAEIREQFR